MPSSTRFKYTDITPFAKCPSCNRMIELESFTDTILSDGRKCPFCFIFIEKKEIISSSEKYLKTTNGLRSAEQTESYALLPVVFILMMLEPGITYFFDWGKYNVLFFLTLLFCIFCTLGGFLNTRFWLTQFGMFQTNDEEFTIAKKKVGRAQIIWVWANIAIAVWLVIYIKFF